MSFRTLSSLACSEAPLGPTNPSKRVAKTVRRAHLRRPIGRRKWPIAIENGAPATTSEMLMMIGRFVVFATKKCDDGFVA